MALPASHQRGHGPQLVLRTFDEDRQRTKERPPPTSSGFSGDATLSQFFEGYFLPVYLRSVTADAKTIAEYRTAVNFWIRLLWDPPLRLIDNAACAAFVYEDLNREDGRAVSPNTVRKHCTHLQMILHAAGPQTREHPWAATPYGLFGEDPFGRPRSTPWFTKPPEREKPPEDGLSVEEIERLLEVASHAEKPIIDQCLAATWWLCLLRFGYNSGLRRKSLLALRRSWITPFGDAGMLLLPGRASKKNAPKQIYVSPDAMVILNEIPTGDQVFPWPESLVSFNRYRVRLWKEAGVPLEKRFHGLRKAIGSELYAISPRAAQLQLGHQSEQTTRRSYVSKASAAASLEESIGPAMRRVRQPKLRSPNAQKFLF